MLTRVLSIFDIDGIKWMTPNRFPQQRHRDRSKTRRTAAARRGAPRRVYAAWMCMGVHGDKSRRRRRGPPWGAAAVGKVSLRNGDENVFYEAGAAAADGRNAQFAFIMMFLMCVMWLVCVM